MRVNIRVLDKMYEIQEKGIDSIVALEHGEEEALINSLDRKWGINDKDIVTVEDYVKGLTNVTVEIIPENNNPDTNEETDKEDNGGDN